MRKAILGRVLAVFALFCALPAQAAPIAVFGSNGIGTYLASLGHTITYASDADIATVGFLNDFSMLVVTRENSNFGDGLSAAAAAQVQAAVSGRAVLFNGDFADGISDESWISTAFSNAANWILGGGGFGYLGEFNGSVMAFGSNADDFSPLGLFTGSAAPLGCYVGGVDGAVAATQAGHPVLAALGFPYNSGEVECGAIITGYDSNQVIAVFDGGNPAILANSGFVQVPEPASLAFMGLGLGVLAFLRRRQRA